MPASSQAIPAAAGETIAAVDLGSNSFRMALARVAAGRLQVTGRFKEPVRLAAGLDRERRLDAAAQARALACLERFGQRLQPLPRARVRAVGTNTLRQARETESFLSAAEAALGHPIEVISGAEEARLIYAGVAQDWRAQAEGRLVVDIGGGSTELVVGEGAQPKLIESLPLGAVVHTRRYFPQGVIARNSWQAAVAEARAVLARVAGPLVAAGWDVAVGASGSVKAARAVCRANGWSGETITRVGLASLVAALLDAGHIDSLGLPGLSGSRRPIFAGGVAVLAAVFEALGVETMTVSDRALREGLLQDLRARVNAPDATASR